MRYIAIVVIALGTGAFVWDAAYASTTASQNCDWDPDPASTQWSDPWPYCLFWTVTVNSGNSAFLCEEGGECSIAVYLTIVVSQVQFEADLTFVGTNLLDRQHLEFPLGSWDGTLTEVASCDPAEDWFLSVFGQCSGAPPLQSVTIIDTKGTCVCVSN